MDRESYRKMYKLPKPRDHKTVESLDKSNQMNINNSKYRIDYRPRVFLKLMRIELFIFLIGIGFVSCMIYLI